MTTDLHLIQVDLEATTARLLAESPIHSVFPQEIQADCWRQMAVIAEAQLRRQGTWWRCRSRANDRGTGRALSEQASVVRHAAWRALASFLPYQTERAGKLMGLTLREDVVSLVLREVATPDTECRFWNPDCDSEWVNRCLNRVCASFHADVADHR